MTKSAPVLKELEESENGSIVALTLSYLIDAGGARVGLSRAKYFIRDTPLGLKVELVEHSQVPLGDGNVHDSLESLAI